MPADTSFEKLILTIARFKSMVRSHVQIHSEIGKCFSNPGTPSSKLDPRTLKLGSGKVVGKALIVDHM